jgi:glycosyltransferase involved in cell wall biosynthesis
MMPARMNRATGFVMPSQRESFGLVFIESLMAGTPIAYPRPWAVDGYFDDQPFALAVDPRSVDAIADAMARLVRDEATMKTALARWQDSGGPARFSTAVIARDYIAALHAAMAGPA